MSKYRKLFIFERLERLELRIAFERWVICATEATSSLASYPFESYDIVRLKTMFSSYSKASSRLEEI
jgi:hypothetical protein